MPIVESRESKIRSKEGILRSFRSSKHESVRIKNLRFSFLAVAGSNGHFHGYARPVVQVAPERSRAVVRRIFTTGDGQGSKEESDAKTHLRTRYTTPFKALGASRGSSRYCRAPQIRSTWPPSPYHAGVIASWGSGSTWPRVSDRHRQFEKKNGRRPSSRRWPDRYRTTRTRAWTELAARTQRAPTASIRTPQLP